MSKPLWTTVTKLAVRWGVTPETAAAWLAAGRAQDIVHPKAPSGKTTLYRLSEVALLEDSWPAERPRKQNAAGG